MAVELNSEKSFLDALYCEEEDESVTTSNGAGFEETENEVSLFPLPLLEQDLRWEDEELQTLISKEKESIAEHQGTGFSSADLFLARKEAVEWVLKINAHYGFSSLTAVLAVNYLDRFLSSRSFQRDKPWMMQLAAVACLSLAAKVEETYVPLLLDLQVEGAKYVFEAKTIQRMELLVLSSLQWRMNPVTPLSFLDHIIKRLSLKSYLHWEVLKGCENLILSIIADSRFKNCLPSVLATATVLHVIHQAEPSRSDDYEKQLLSVLKISKEQVSNCSKLISGKLSGVHDGSLKRKREITAVYAAAFFNCGSSNESWEAESCISSASSSSCDSTHQPLLKKARAQEQHLRLQVFVDGIGSPH